MIYAGFVQFNDTCVNTDKLTTVLSKIIGYPPSIIQKESLFLCYGKLSPNQDMDKVLKTSSSILIGRAFDKNNDYMLDEKNLKELVNTTENKENIFKSIWGKYIFIHFDEKLKHFKFVIDSTGQLPFFYHQFTDGSILFSSTIEIIIHYLSQKPEYNWNYLSSYLIYGNSSSILTPFQSINELPPGCCLTLSQKRMITTPFWDPMNSYKVQHIYEKNTVDVLQSTLKPWIEPYQNICVSLSGGLDSSSLVYCLKDIIHKDQTLIALNYYHSQIQSSNESTYARKVCQETNIELIEMDASSSLPFDVPQKKQTLIPNKPFPGLISLKWQENMCNHIPFKDSWTFISGHGSDHILMRPPSKHSLSDYIIEQGLKGSKEKLIQLSQFFRDPYFPLLKSNAIKLVSYFFNYRGDKRHAKNIFHEPPPWLNNEILKQITSNFIHPMYKHLPKKIPPGKYDQIDLLYEGLASIHVELMNQLDPTFYPFLYEPVVEFALSHPTYELFEKGYDRYPLRKDVSDCFNTDTVWRRDKSQTTGIFQLGIKQNLDYVLDLCLNGHFAKKGLIDKQQLHKTIVNLSNGDIKYLWPFTHLASTEIFLNFWDDVSL